MQAESHEAEFHERMRRGIDQSLAGAATPAALAAHLGECAACREYREAGVRAIAGLSGFSFAVSPGLDARVVTALARRAQQLEAKESGRRRLARNSLAALALTLAGSLVVMQLGSGLAAAFHVEPAQVERVLIALWVAPSLCLCLLLPMLSAMSAGRMEKGWNR